MFFLIGGIQPRTVTLDEAPRLCPSCGLAQARLKRVDHYVSLFFIPLIPVKRGEPVVICDRCGTVSSPEEPVRADHRSVVEGCCRHCGEPVESRFAYCPYCGGRL